MSQAGAEEEECPGRLWGGGDGGARGMGEEVDGWGKRVI